ncbi:MAG: hypothetical protein CSA79_05990 [Thiothrix nivea]|nr:MAG: hypothetical protein CSA79_05990 [Thiothrix nivea]
MLGETPESLRDLSVSLNKVGGVAQQQGRWGDAQLAYQESLEIRRRLKALLGETPESLRDLSVSLYNLGRVFLEQNQSNLAMPYLQEGLAVCKRIAEMLPDLPAYTEGVGFFETLIDQATQQTSQ